MAIKNIVAVVCGMDEEYPYHIILGINKYAREHSMNVSYFAAFGGVIDNEGFDIGEYSIYNLPDFSSFDGALLLSNTFSNPDIRNEIINRVKESGIPSVIFECKDYEEFCDVSINNYSVMKKMVEHLIHVHGARTFNYVSGPEANPEAKERYRAFRDALAENGIEFDMNRFYQGYFRSYDGIKAVEAFEKSGMSLPDAFVCANDSMALTVMTRLQNLGYVIPDDVMITGFDETFNAQNSCPVLTTVRRPLFYSGSEACRILSNLIDKVEQPRNTFLEAYPVFTESCGCKQDNSEDILEFKKNTFLRYERTYANIHMLNRLVAGLAGAENINECVESIEQMLGVIKCKDFCLCLVKNWENTYNVTSLEDTDTSYPPVMTAIEWKNGVRRTVDQFPSRNLFPEPFTVGGNVSYFLPLHFNQRCLGYMIIINNDFPINSLLCHTLIMSIGNAIDSISKLNVLDTLCGIYNRNGFYRNAMFIYKDCVAEEKALTLCFIDVDGLKMINDTYGHKEGDFAIKSISDAISSSCGSADICGRFGGDEFVVIGTGEDFAESFISRFEKRIEELNSEYDKPFLLSASTGYISVVPGKDDSLMDIIQQADERMYEVKKKKYKNKKWKKR